MANLSRNLRLGLGLLISLACLAYVLREVDFGLLWRLTRRVNPLYVLGLALLLALSLWFRSWRWRLLLEPIRRCRLGALYSANLIGLTANNLLPARLGELVRAYTLSRLEPVSASSALATLVLERVLDGLCLLLFLFAALLFADPQARAGAFSVTYLRGAGLFLLAVYLGVLALMLCLWRWPGATMGWLGRLAGRISPALGQRVEGLLETFHQGLAIIGRARRLVPLGLVSLAVWLPILGMFLLFLPAMEMPPSLLLAAMAMAGGFLGAAVPAGPGFVGTFQLAVSWCLMIAGADPQKAMAFSLIFWVVTNLPLTLAGLAEMWRRGTGLGPRKQGAKGESSAC